MPIPLPATGYFCTVDDVRALKQNLVTVNLRDDDEVEGDIRNGHSVIWAALYERYDLSELSEVPDVLRTINIYLAVADAVLSVPALKGYSRWAEGIRKQGTDLLEKLRTGEYGMAVAVRTNPPEVGGEVLVLQTGEERTPSIDRSDELTWAEPSSDMTGPSEDLEEESLYGD